MSSSAEYMRGYMKGYIERLKEQAFDILGDTCADCGFADKRALEFDHVDGGGSEERRQKLKNQTALLRAVINEPHRFQVLCRNCNWIKYLVAKEEEANRYDPEVAEFLAKVKAGGIA